MCRDVFSWSTKTESDTARPAGISASADTDTRTGGGDGGGRAASFNGYRAFYVLQARILVFPLPVNLNKTN